MRRPFSLKTRLIGLAIAWSFLILIAGGLALSWVFAQAARDAFDDRLDVLVKSLVAAVDNAEDGRLTDAIAGEPRFERPLSGWYWQIEGPIGLLRSRSLWDRDLPLTDEDEVIISGPLGQQLRMLSRTVEIGGEDYRFRVAGETSSIVLATQRFIVTVAIALAILGLGLILAVFVQVWYGLEPVRRLRDKLAAVRTGQAEVLEGQFPAELTPLVDELNGLIAHNRRVIERARSHAGNLAHGLKTPLSIIANDADGTDDTRLARTTRKQLPRVQHLIDHHLSRARAAGTGTTPGTAWTPVGPVVDDLVRTLTRLHRHRDLDFAVELADGASFRGDREDLMEILGNLLENASKWAALKIAVRVEPDPDGLRFTVDDDGPGLSEADRERAVERGRRMDEAVPGHGLGLAIVRDVTALYAGHLALSESPWGGLRAEVVLPGAVAASADREVPAGPPGEWVGGRVVPAVRRWIAPPGSKPLPKR